MSNGMPIMLAVLLGEIVLLALVLLTIAYLRNRAQRKRDLKAAKTLIERIRNGKAEREKTIVQFLEQGMGLSGESLQQAKVATLRAELGMLQRIAGVYRLREAAALARMDDDLFAAIDPYHALTAVPAEAVAGDADPADENELEQLRKENQRLSEELTITMETMGRMLNEYSSMFAGGAPDLAAPIAATATAAAETLGDDEVMIASTGAVDEPAAAVDEQPTAGEPIAEVDEIGDVDHPDEVGEVEIAASVNPDDEGNTDVDIVADDIEIAAVDQDAQSADDVIIAAPSAEVGQDTVAVPDASLDAEIVFEVAEDAAEPPPEADASLDAGAEDEDEIAAILREAQSQEMSARGSTEPAADGVAGDEPMSAGVMIAEQTPRAVDQDVAAETGVDGTEDLDDLFDAAGEQDVDAPAEGEPPLTSHGGG